MLTRLANKLVQLGSRSAEARVRLPTILYLAWIGVARQNFDRSCCETLPEFVHLSFFWSSHHLSWPGVHLDSDNDSQASESELFQPDELRKPLAVYHSGPPHRSGVAFHSARRLQVLCLLDLFYSVLLFILRKASQAAYKKSRLFNKSVSPNENRLQLSSSAIDRTIDDF